MLWSQKKWPILVRFLSDLVGIPSFSIKLNISCFFFLGGGENGTRMFGIFLDYLMGSTITKQPKLGVWGSSFCSCVGAEDNSLTRPHSTSVFTVAFSFERGTVRLEKPGLHSVRLHLKIKDVINDFQLSWITLWCFYESVLSRFFSTFLCSRNDVPKRNMFPSTKFLPPTYLNQSMHLFLCISLHEIPSLKLT